MSAARVYSGPPLLQVRSFGGDWDFMLTAAPLTKACEALVWAIDGKLRVDFDVSGGDVGCAYVRLERAPSVFDPANRTWSNDFAAHRARVSALKAQIKREFRAAGWVVATESANWYDWTAQIVDAWKRCEVAS